MPSRPHERKVRAKLRSHYRWRGWDHARKVCAVLRMIGNDRDKYIVQQWLALDTKKRQKSAFKFLQDRYDYRMKKAPPDWVTEYTQRAINTKESTYDEPSTS